MFKVLTGDLFESRACAWVNAVNCVGVMGKGVALEFKKRFPDMFEDYCARCARRQVLLGEPYLSRRIGAHGHQLSHQGSLALSITAGRHRAWAGSLRSACA